LDKLTGTYHYFVQKIRNQQAEG